MTPKQKNSKKQVRLAIGYLLLSYVFGLKPELVLAMPNDPRVAVEQKAPSIKTTLQSLQENIPTRNVLFTEQPTLPKGEVLIFVSASMPEQSLEQWFIQAQKIHAALIIRGFIHNSLVDTQNWVNQLLTQNNGEGGIEIDPIAFERHGIHQVPAVVATESFPLSENNIYLSSSFDMVSGNVSLREALNVIEDKGEIANETARDALSELK
jgi:conjugal transfer pilus assembly protein TrbC